MADARMKPFRGIEAVPQVSCELVYLQTKDFVKALKDAFLMGGQAQKKHDRVRIVMGSLGCEDPFATLQVTNHGETRIKHCVKYDLGDGWRLVTRKIDNTCIFLFVGNHEDVDRWLDAHRGEDFGVKGNRLVRIPGVGVQEFEARKSIADYHRKALIDLLDSDSMDHVLGEIAPRCIVPACPGLDFF